MKFLNLLLLAVFVFSGNVYSQVPTLQEVTSEGNTTTQLIIIDPVADAFRSFIIKRQNGSVTTQAALSNNKTAAVMTYFPDISNTAVQYGLSLGANVLQYYNNGTYETVWRSGNFNPANYLPLAGGSITGDITIGTTALQKQLNVNGNIKARKVKVTLTDWPDYVFGRDYELMPLPQLGEYIEANKHLPGVPSAETVEQEGLELGENQAVLLKKIEELTLYILEQHKKQEAMEQKLAEMEKKLEAR